METTEAKSEKVLYPDGIGCCIWLVIDPDDEDVGLAFDFPFDDIDDLINVLQQIKETEAEIFEE